MYKTYPRSQEVYFGHQDPPYGSVCQWAVKDLILLTDGEKQELVSHAPKEWQPLCAWAVREFWLSSTLFENLEITHFFTYMGLKLAIERSNHLLTEFEPIKKVIKDFQLPIVSGALSGLYFQYIHPVTDNIPTLPSHIQVPKVLIDRSQPDYRTNTGFR